MALSEKLVAVVRDGYPDVHADNFRLSVVQIDDKKYYYDWYNESDDDIKNIFDWLQILGFEGKVTRLDSRRFSAVLTDPDKCIAEPPKKMKVLKKDEMR